jgi:hypothetical protein
MYKCCLRGGLRRRGSSLYNRVRVDDLVIAEPELPIPHYNRYQRYKKERESH